MKPQREDCRANPRAQNADPESQDPQEENSCSKHKQNKRRGTRMLPFISYSAAQHNSHGHCRDIPHLNTLIHARPKTFYQLNMPQTLV